MVLAEQAFPGAKREKPFPGIERAHQNELIKRKRPPA
jgi:hypothetical protein